MCINCYFYFKSIPFKDFYLVIRIFSRMYFENMDFRHWFIFLLGTIPILTVDSDASTEIKSMESKLRKDLLNKDNYDKLTSPVQNNVTESGLAVSVAMLVLHVHSLDEINGILTINGWFLAIWKDMRLTWVPSEYGSITLLYAQDKSIWVPDITIYNNAESMEMDHYGNAELRLHSDGTIIWVPPITLRSTCVIDHDMYPFDEHDCTVDLGVWSYGGIVFQMRDVDKEHELDVLDKFGTENPLWEVVTNSQSIRNISYDCCPGSHYQVIELKLHLRRRSPFHKFLVVVPSILAMFLTLATFWLPPTDNLKFNLCSLVIFIEVLLLLFLGYEIPPGGKSIPAIVLFCGNSFIMSSLALLIGIGVKKVNTRDSSVPVPQSLLSLLRGPAGKVLCLQSQDWQGDQQLLDTGNQVEFGNNPVDHESGGLNNQQQDGQIQSSNWTLIAIAIDRTCFILYCLIFIFIIIGSFCI